jgi:hypothetical protein
LNLRDELEALARRELGLNAGLPDGELAASLDSLQRLALVVAIEDHFRIQFDPDDEETVRTVDDVIRVIERKRDAARG